GALAEQGAADAVSDADATTAGGADVDRAHAHAGGLDRGEHGDHRRGRRAGRRDDQDLRFHGTRARLTTSWLTRVPGRSPRITARPASAAGGAIGVRAWVVAEPMCGATTTPGQSK